MEHPKKLRRSLTDRVVAGVCGGLGEYFETDSLIFRALFVLLALVNGIGILMYLFLLILMPKEGEERGGVPEDVAERAKQMVEDLKARHFANKNRRRTGLGLVVLLAGILFLLNQLFPGRIEWDLVAPLAVIGLGLVLLLRSPRP
jgi:phage shock protein C